METNQIIEQGENLVAQFRKCGDNYPRYEGLLATAKEFIRVYGGPKSQFIEGLNKAENYGYTADHVAVAAEVVEAFVNSIKSGLIAGISPKRKAQIDVVSDFLEQAIDLLEDQNVHAAVPAVIIGASLEEFLRSWVESENLSLGNRKPSIDTYTSLLRTAELITKQDVKDITSWAGVRNHAAHGEWEKVANKEYVRLILEGVNLFIRKYGSEHAA
jgi:hypothetical protein